MNLNARLTTLLQAHGANLIGFADVEGLAPDGYKYAIVAALALPPAIVEEIPVGPTPVCGKCFAACPYTKGYLNRAKAAK